MAVTIGPDGTPMLTDDYGRQSSVIPLPVPTTVEGQVPQPPFGPPPPPSPSDRATSVPALGEPAPTTPVPVTGVDARTGLPSVVGFPGGRAPSRFDLTKNQAEAAPAVPGGVSPYGPGVISPNGAPAPGYLQASTDPITGQPTAMNPSLTKLGKLLTVLRGAAVGGIVGSTQPTFGGGYLAAQQNQNQQINQNLQEAKARQNLGLVDTPWGAMPLPMYTSLLQKMLPAQEATKRAEAVQESKSETSEATAEIRAKAMRDVAQIAHRFKVAPGGLYDAQTGQLVSGTGAGILVTPQIAQDYKLPEQFINTRMKLTDFAQVEKAQNFGYAIAQTAEGPVIVSKSTGQAKPVTGPGGQTYLPTAWAGLTQVADPDHPGEGMWVPKTSAAGMATQQSASMQIPRQELKGELPRNAGDLMLSFKTALDHAKLLEDAVRELDNPNSQTLAGLINRIKTEFGATGPTGAQVIADAYTREITKMLSGGHMTDSEVGTVGRSLDPQRQTQDQVLEVLEKYRALSASKLKQLQAGLQAPIDKAEANRRAAKNPKAPPAVAPPAEHPFFKKFGGAADTATPAPATR